jgi:hypothetical protein
VANEIISGLDHLFSFVDWMVGTAVHPELLSIIKEKRNMECFISISRKQVSASALITFDFVFQLGFKMVSGRKRLISDLL